MSHRFYTKIVWYSRRTLEQIGLPGVAGLGLLALCAIYYFFAVMPANKAVCTLNSEAAVQMKSHREADRVSPARQLTSFYRVFPRVKGATDALEKLHDAAMLQGVTLEQGEYHLVRNGADKLARYEVALPIKGDYLHLRKFLSQALTDIPYLSLDSMEFQRQKVSETTVDAQVKMTIFLADN